MYAPRGTPTMATEALTNPLAAPAASPHRGLSGRRKRALFGIICIPMNRRIIVQTMSCSDRIEAMSRIQTPMTQPGTAPRTSSLKSLNVQNL